MLVLMHKSTHEKKVIPITTTNKKQFNKATNLLPGYNCIFNVTNKNNNFYFATSITGKFGSIQKPTPPRTYE